ncbi:hypothetical protein SeMB42_g01252 [Synchytrium endobioticum]|uniref:Uncharacterized protein n=1 Tax=Synchytrium endobioticum TaxID=286115 RepID=A0A507DLV6_9FUNG|nr:hypothetical protein SeLEV6574_g01656 [Synchytrium endobioticum]TPX52689.1 hypothetical protein SeMB42_g01252 [Synchytrium endobioticum]
MLPSEYRMDDITYKGTEAAKMKRFEDDWRALRESVFYNQFRRNPQSIDDPYVRYRLHVSLVIDVFGNTVSLADPKPLLYMAEYLEIKDSLPPNIRNHKDFVGTVLNLRMQALLWSDWRDFKGCENVMKEICVYRIEDLSEEMTGRYKKKLEMFKENLRTIWTEHERNKPKKQMKIAYPLPKFEQAFKKWATDVVKDLVIDHLPDYLAPSSGANDEDDRKSAKSSEKGDLSAMEPASKITFMDPLKVDSLRQKIGNAASTYMATTFRSECVGAFKRMLASGESVEDVFQKSLKKERAFEKRALEYSEQQGRQSKRRRWSPWLQGQGSMKYGEAVDNDYIHMTVKAE